MPYVIKEFIKKVPEKAITEKKLFYNDYAGYYQFNEKYLKIANKEGINHFQKILV